MIDRTHEVVPQLISPFGRQVLAVIGERNVAVLLQSYDQPSLMPLPERGLLLEGPVAID